MNVPVHCSNGEAVVTKYLSLRVGDLQPHQYSLLLSLTFHLRQLDVKTADIMAMTHSLF